MKTLRPFLAATLLGASALAAMPAAAQMRPLHDPVVAHPDPESLFTSSDPRLHRNKQAALHIMRELLQCNQWSRAGEWLTERYIQHNPLAASGLEGVVNYFVNVAKRQPTATCDKLTSPVVSVQAEGDEVTVLAVRTLPWPGDPSKTYTTTWFDTWTFVDGKADEHWDPATLPAWQPALKGSVDEALLREQDRAAIEALMWRYVRAIDSWNPDAYAAVFTENGAFGQVQGRAALKEFVAGMKQSRAERSEPAPDLHHVMSNQTIEFVSRDHARVHYYWQTVTAGSPGGATPNLLAQGRGVDDVVRVDGEWLIQKRNVTPTEG